MAKMKSCGKSGKINFCITLSCFEIFMWTIALVLGLWNVIQAKKVYGNHQPIFSKGETEVAKIEDGKGNQV